jgi:hypothetical protein
MRAVQFAARIRRPSLEPTPRRIKQTKEPIMTLFRLDASIFPDQSVSRELADIVEAEWTAEHPDEPVIRRHIGTNPLPSTAWADAVVGQQLPQDAALLPNKQRSNSPPRWPTN